MTTALEEVEGSASRPSRSLPPRKTRYSLYRRLGGPQGRSGQVRKISSPPGFDRRTVQPVASGYTDCATRPTFHIIPKKISISFLRTFSSMCTATTMLRTRTGTVVFSSLLAQRSYYLPKLINVGIPSKENQRIFCVLSTSKISNFCMGFVICSLYGEQQQATTGCRAS